MKISETFGLGATQFELDFVDIDTEFDTPLFLDPLHISAQPDRWAVAANVTLLGFFQRFVDLVNADKLDDARAQFTNLNEPNETCLGLSQGAPQGLGMGDTDGDVLYHSILQSTALSTGVVQSISDFKFFVPGISNDKVSDMATNIIRKHLIDYTMNQCELWGIPLQDGVASGHYWDAAAKKWAQSFERMLIVDGRKILLVPKHSVSYVKAYTTPKLHRHFILTYLQTQHLKVGSPLVRTRKISKKKYVTKKDLIETEAPERKEFVADFITSNPLMFDNFHQWAKSQSTSLGNKDLPGDGALYEEKEISKYLIEKLRKIPTGKKASTEYQKTVCGILEYLFYPSLVSPILERPINDGRKRIDIMFDNHASSGFFHRVHSVFNIPASYIFAECKNYSVDVTNPELDQLLGRLAVNRGMVGLMLCRKIDDMNLLLRRCKDAYDAESKVLLPIVDDDIVKILQSIESENRNVVERFIGDRYRDVVVS